MSTNPYIRAYHNRLILATLVSNGKIGVGKVVTGVGNEAVWCYKSIFSNSDGPVGVDNCAAPDENIIGNVDIVIDRRINCGRAFKLGISIYNAFLAEPDPPAMNERDPVLEGAHLADHDSSYMINKGSEPTGHDA